VELGEPLIDLEAALRALRRAVRQADRGAGCLECVARAAQ